MAEGKALTQRQLQGKLSVIDEKINKYKGYIAKLNTEKKKLAAQKKKLAAAADKPKKSPVKAKPAAKTTRKPAAQKRAARKKSGQPDAGPSVIEAILSEVKKTGIGMDDIIEKLKSK